MIFKKESNFPYPILAPFSKDYPNSRFNLNIELADLDDVYRFSIKYDLKSPFIEKLITDKKAKLYLVIESKDEKFFELNNEFIDIKKSRISLDTRTFIQLFVISTKRLSFMDNHDIDSFYDLSKKRIYIEKYSTLAMSNIEAFDGEIKKPFELFSWSEDETIDSEFKVKLDSEMIHLIFRDKSFHFMDLPKNQQAINNHYIYIGLQYALVKFLMDHTENIDEALDIDEIDVPPRPLERKIYDLLKVKEVHILDFENIDIVIHQITDNIIFKHTHKIREVIKGAD